MACSRAALESARTRSPPSKAAAYWFTEWSCPRLRTAEAGCRCSGSNTAATNMPRMNASSARLARQYLLMEFLDIGTDSFRPTPTSFGGATATVVHDVLKFRVWTGNFNIVYPVLINWITGKLQPAWRCIETTSKGQVERCSYPITVEAHRDKQPTFVRLFPEADEIGRASCRERVKRAV